MQMFWNLAQIISGVLLVGLIMLQTKGTGLGSTFGSDLSFYSTKRGAEKMIFVVTIIVSVIFLTIPVIRVVY